MTGTEAGRSRPRLRGHRNLLGALFVLVLACGLGAGAAWAYWSTDAVPGGSGTAVAGTVDQGATPVAAAAGSSVTVDWAARSLSDGNPVDGYVVRRYDVDTLTSQPLLSACTGTLTVLTCTEDSVPEGHWVYSVTPMFATNWHGPESAMSDPVWVDSTPPVNGLTVSEVTGNAVKIGDTVYYRGIAAGSFTLTNAVSDSGSGPASSTTADLTGSSSGWSHTPSTVSTPAGGPFVSTPFSWDAGTSSAPAEDVTGRDVVENTTTTTLSFVDDSDGPTGGSVTATGLVGTGSTYAASTSASLTLVKGTDASGVAATGNLLMRASAPLDSDGTADGVCGTFGDFSTVTGGTDPSSPKVDTGLVTGCYRYQYVVADVLGNPTTYTSNDVKVDTTAPTAPTRSFGSFNNTYWNGISGSVFYRSTAASGSFTVTASTSDLESGVLRYNFPAAFGTNWSATPGDTDEMTYSWSGTPQTVSAKSMTATNHANKTSPVSATFTPTVDVTAPTAGTLSYLNGTTTSDTVDVSFTSGTDAGSGLAAKVLERASAPMTNGLCGAFGPFDPIAGDPISPYTDDTLVTDTCYKYDYETPDNVGNQRTNVSASIVKVSSDVAGPTGGSITATGLVGTGAAYTASTTATLTLDKGTDPNGPATTGNTVKRATATLVSDGTADGTCGAYGAFTLLTTDPTTPYSNTGLTTGCYVYQYVALDNLGNATTYTSGEVKVDTTASSTPTRTFSALSNTYWNGVSALYYRSVAPSGSFTVTAGATDLHSGVASYTFPTAALIGTNWIATPGAVNEMTYSWTSTPTGSTARSITATNHATKVSVASTTFIPTLDSTAPGVGTVTYLNGSTTSTSVNVTFTNGTDTGSGLAAKVLERASAPMTNGLCGTFGPFDPIATNPISPYTDDTLVTDTCYKYDYETPDNVGNQRTNVSASIVKVSSDVAGPTGGSITATGLVGTGAAYTASTTATLALDKGTDPNGPAATGNTVKRATATLVSGGTADGTCGAYGAFTLLATEPTTPYSNTGLTTGCYVYQYVALDNLGNATTYTSGEVKVDTSASSTPTRTFGSFSNVYWDGASASVFYRSNAATGSFTVTASATDLHSGIASYTFPSSAAFGTNWTATPGALGVTTYSWSGSPAAVTAKSITATNHATKISVASTTFTPTADITAPTGGTMTYPNGGTPNTNVNVTLGTVTDGTGSGVASKLLQRASAPLTNGTCGGYTAFATIASSPTSPYTDNTLVMDTCYQYQYVATDNLGNQVTTTSANVVKVSTDVTGPTGGSITATGLVGTGSAYAASTSVNLTFSAGTDPSGVATTNNLLQRASAPLTSTGGADGVCGAFGSFATVTNGTDPSSPFTNTLATTAFCWRYQYVVKDNLGYSTTYTSGDVKVDTSVPSAPSRSFGSFNNTYWDGSSATVFYRSLAATGSFTVSASGALDAQSGISAYTFSAFGTNWTSTPGAFGVNTYSWSGAPAVPGARSVTAVNNANLGTVSATYTPTIDNTAPTAGSVTYPDTTTTNTTVSVTFTTGTDAGSGVGTRLLQRAAATLTGSTCGSYGSFTTVATNPALSPYDDTVPSSGFCYKYQYVVTDNVGNTGLPATSANVVKVTP